ncbi:MAG: PIN domain-containing protein [Bacteroidota bacterium]
MRYLLDIDILLLYLREDSTAKEIEDQYHILEKEHLALILIVSKGELKALALKNKWGNRRIAKLEEFLNQFFIIDINAEDIIDRYAEIDAYSQGKLDRLASNFTARNMGKNDMWIAATASITEASLITTDKDFHHLHKTFIDLIYVKR